MRKFLLFGALVLSLGMFSCQTSEDGAGAGEATVTISATLPSEMASTRAYGDGTTVDRCIMEVYLDGKLYGERQTVGVSNLAANFSVRLVSGKTYDLVFWADKSDGNNKGDLHYDTSEFPEVSFKGDYQGNNDDRDAFFGTIQITADQTKTVPVTLHRPFGQLNVNTLDMNDVPENMRPTQVSIEFESVPTGMNLLTGELTASTAPVSYSAPANLIDSKSGKLSIDYIFAPKGTEQYLANFTMSFLKDNVEVASAYEFTTIPLQRNYRTIVSGYLLTKKADISVTVDPEFDGSINHVITEVQSTKDLTLFLDSGGHAKLTADITMVNMPMVMSFKEVDIDLNGHTLTFANSNTGALCGFKIYQNTTIRNGKIVSNSEDDLDATLVCGSGYSLTLDGIDFEGSASCVGTAANGDNVNIVVKNSTIKCHTYAVSTIAAKPTGTNVHISIENSTLESLTPVLFNIPSTLTIDNCTIKALMQGLILRGGTATVSNSRITFNTTESFTSQDEAEEFANAFDSSDWQTGNQVELAAITAGNKAEGSYQYPTELNLVNTTVETIGSYASLFSAMYVWANQTEGLGVTITYDSDCVFTGDVTYGSKNIVVNGVEQ